LYSSFDISTSTSTISKDPVVIKQVLDEPVLVGIGALAVKNEDPVVIKQVLDEPVLVGIGALAVKNETRAAASPTVHHDVNPDEGSNYYLMESTIPSSFSSCPSSSYSNSNSNSNSNQQNNKNKNTLLFVFGPHSNG
jgi:hypothetical protein